MKKKQKIQLMQKKPKELSELIGKKRSEIAQALLKQSEEKNKNIVRTMKRELAVLLTALREQELTADIAAGGGTHE